MPRRVSCSPFAALPLTLCSSPFQAAPRRPSRISISWKTWSEIQTLGNWQESLVNSAKSFAKVQWKQWRNIKAFLFRTFKFLFLVLQELPSHTKSLCHPSRLYWSESWNLTWAISLLTLMIDLSLQRLCARKREFSHDKSFSKCLKPDACPKKLHGYLFHQSWISSNFRTHFFSRSLDEIGNSPSNRDTKG